MPEVYLAFDCYAYPGDGMVAALWARGFRIAGIYLNHARGGRDAGWIGNAQALARNGWGLIPLYLGWQTVDVHGNPVAPPNDPVGAGDGDANEAATLLLSAGFAPGTTVYFDMENGDTPAGTYQTYLETWIAGIRRAGFTPAMYCSHHVTAWPLGRGLSTWSYHIPLVQESSLDPADFPTDAIDNGCLGTQIRQDRPVSGLAITIDFSRFTVPDPASPTVTVAEASE